MDADFLNEDRKTKHDPNITSTAFNFEGFLNLHLLKRLVQSIIDDLGPDLYRYKGILNVAGVDKKFVFQGVGMLFSGTFTTEWGEDEERDCRFVFIGKGLDEKQIRQSFFECECDEELRFKVGDVVMACVGGPSKVEDHSTVIVDLEGDSSDDSGDDEMQVEVVEDGDDEMEVDCLNAPGWARGTITRLWDNANPYRIELDSTEIYSAVEAGASVSEAREVWAPVDSKEFVRRVDSSSLK